MLHEAELKLKSSWTSSECPEQNLRMKNPTSKSKYSGVKSAFFLLMLAFAGCAEQTGSTQATVRELAFGDACQFDGATLIQDTNGLRAALGMDTGSVPIDFAKEQVLAISDRKSTRLNSSHLKLSRMPSSA